MGMAASQARFLGLTARKTNVEYQGQQVNQQRTALANESSGLFNQMTALKVPLPPSATQFYTSRYAFSAPDASQFTIASMEKRGSEYWIKMEYKEEVQKAFEHDTKLVTFTTSEDGKTETMTYGGQDYTKRGATVDFSKEEPFAAVLEAMNEKDYLPKKKADANGVIPEYDKDDFVSYSNSKTGKTFYILKSQIEEFEKTDGKESLQLHFANQVMETNTAWANAQFAEDPTNTSKYQSVTMTGVEPASALEKLGFKKDETTGEYLPKTFSLDIAGYQDEDGLEVAMKDYEYQKMLYERSIQDINARTENIQSQDKSLELKLKQLDTEQKALQTEMDAVQKVIQKNVETTFKTFG